MVNGTAKESNATRKKSFGKDESFVYVSNKGKSSYEIYFVIDFSSILQFTNNASTTLKDHIYFAEANLEKGIYNCTCKPILGFRIKKKAIALTDKKTRLIRTRKPSINYLTKN